MENPRAFFQPVKEVSPSYELFGTTSYFEKRQDFFICSTHRVNKDKCSGHYIRAVVLEQIVWKHIQEVISVVTRYEAYFRSEMEQNPD